MRNAQRLLAALAVLAACAAAGPPPPEPVPPAPVPAAILPEKVSPPEAEPPAALTPAHTEQVPAERASGILGTVVEGPDGHDLGRIIDVLVDDTGKPRAAVIDFGGFFGMGSRKIAVSWGNLHFSPAAPNGMQIRLDLSADQIKAAPAYTDAAPATVVVSKSK